MPPGARAGAAGRVFGYGCFGCLGLVSSIVMALLVTLSVESPVALGLATAAAVLPVPTFIFLVLQLDRYEREPRRVLLAAFIWGAGIATLISAIFNDVIGVFVVAAVGEVLGEVVTASFVAPIVEETSKGLAVLLLFTILRHEFDNVLDGIVYGSIVGIGFAMTENVLYFGRTYVDEGLVGLGLLFYLRVILGGFAHALYTGTTGAALGFARETTNRLLKLVVPLLGFALAIFQHAAWNLTATAVLPSVLPEDLNPYFLLFVIMPLESVFLTGPGLATLVVIAVLAWRREAAVIRTHLSEEVERGTLTPEEYAELPSQRARFRHEMTVLRRQGPRSWLAQRAFHQVATELAFRKWHVSRGERPKPGQVGPEDRYRREIAALRARLA